MRACDIGIQTQEDDRVSFLVVVCQIDWQIFKTDGTVTPLPHPQKTIEGFSNHVCSFTMVAIWSLIFILLYMSTITNYTGKDREYLKKLITTLGGGFTPSMTGKNTVVIAA